MARASISSLPWKYVEQNVPTRRSYARHGPYRVSLANDGIRTYIVQINFLHISSSKQILDPFASNDCRVIEKKRNDQGNYIFKKNF